MAFYYNSSALVTGASSANPIQFNYTAGTVSRLVVLTLMSYTNGGTGTSGTPTYNGDNMTQVGSTQISAEGSTEIWYYLTPDSGESRQISIPNANTNEFRYTCCDFTSGTETASLFGSDLQSDGSNADVVASIASVPTGSVCVSCMVHGEKDEFASVSGCTSLLGTPSVDEGSTQTGAAYSIQGAAGTETHSYISGGTSDDFNYVMGAWEPITSTIEALVGQSDVAISTTGAISRDRAVSGQSDVAISTTGAISRDRAVSGQSDVAISASGSLSVSMALAAQSDISLSVTASLDADKLISGQSDISISATSSLKVTVGLSGQSDIAISTTADLEVTPKGYRKTSGITKPVRGVLVNKTHPLARDMVGCWLLNEGVGDKVSDTCGHIDGRKYGPPPPYWSAGKFGSCLVSTGVTAPDIVVEDTKKALDVITKEITVSAWVYRVGDNSSERYAVKKTSTFQLDVTRSWSDTVRFAVFIGTNYQSLSGGIAVPKNCWTHVAGSYRSGMMRVYMNGKFLTSWTGFTGDIDTTSNNMNLFDNFVSGGKFCHAMVWKRVLSDREIADLYREPFQMFDASDSEMTLITLPAATQALSGQANISISTTADLTILPKGYQQSGGVTKPYRGILPNKTHLLARNMVACWLMDSLNTTGVQRQYDRSGCRVTSNNILYTFTPLTLVAGKHGQAVKTGNSTYLTVLDISTTGLKTSESHSAVLCFKLDEDLPAADNRFVLELGGGFFVRYRYSNGGWQVYHTDGSQSINFTIPTTRYIKNIWQSLVITYDSNLGKVTGYINGIEKGSQTNAAYAPSDANGELRYGRSNEFIIDHAMLWQRCLSEEEVKNLYVNPFQMFDTADSEIALIQPSAAATQALSGQANISISTTADLTVLPKAYQKTGGIVKPLRGELVNTTHPLTRGLVGCWLFNESVGSKVSDLSGNRNNGILQADAYFDAGKFGSALKFNGTTDYVSISDNSLLDFTSDFTISAWIKLVNSGDNAILGNASASSGWAGYVFRVSSGKLSLYTKNGGWTEGIGVVNDDKWRFVVVTNDGTNTKFYIDGCHDRTIAQASPTAETFDAPSIGTYNYASVGFFNGKIDNVQAYNRILTSVEIASLYREPFQMFDTADNEIGLVSLSSEQTEALSGQSDVSISTTASLDVTKQVSGQSDVSISTSGSITRTVTLSGQSDVSISTTADVIVSKTLAGQSDIQISTTGTLDRAVSLSGSVDLAISTTAAIRVDYAIAGQSDIQISTSANMDVSGEVSLSGQSNVSISTTGNIRVDFALSSTSNVQISTTASLDKTVSLSGQSDIQISTTASLEDLVAWYLPSSYAITTGTLDSGELEDVYEEGGDALVLGETTGTPAFEFDFTFGEDIAVPETNLTIAIVGHYQGNPAHNVKIQQYNYNTTTWTNLTGNSNDFPSDSVDQTYIFDLVDDPNYLSGGEIQIRFVHTSAGNINHFFNFDSIALSSNVIRGSSAIQITSSGSLSVQKSLQSQADVQISVSGELSVTSDISLSGQIDVSTVCSGSLEVDRAFSGQVDLPTTVTGALSVKRGIAGTSEISVTCTSDLSVGAVQSLAGVVAIDIATTGVMVRQRSLIGASLVEVSVTGVVGTYVSIAGAVQVDTSLTGVLYRKRLLVGTCDVTTSIVGSLAGLWALSSQSDVLIEVTGTLTGRTKVGWMLGGNVGALNSIIHRN